ncbi:PREDICTED: uncharacterized protein LOC107347291 [Acropora digitifera]|uniref:uncharacterized protein LOC107347291 n=1 Tax=Acropora digitifera TaxID=70779 RepID=UPI00077B09D4|nr:PREDICTED: uncharacterized protein LOC107347291 [Acropora digitifera]
MKTLLFLAFILCTASVALAIKCKVCASPESMEDCKEKEQSVDCSSLPMGYDRCVKMSLEYGGVKSFAKSCFSKQLCEEGNAVYKSCKQISGATCEMTCCDSDNCNSGTAPLVSALVMIVCALTSFYLC